MLWFVLSHISNIYLSPTQTVSFLEHRRHYIKHCQGGILWDTNTGKGGRVTPTPSPSCYLDATCDLFFLTYIKPVRFTNTSLENEWSLNFTIRSNLEILCCDSFFSETKKGCKLCPGYNKRGRSLGPMPGVHTGLHAGLPWEAQTLTPRKDLSIQHIHSPVFCNGRFILEHMQSLSCFPEGSMSWPLWFLFSGVPYVQSSPVPAGQTLVQWNWASLPVLYLSLEWSSSSSSHVPVHAERNNNS